jgi:hypothetical protein
MISIDLGDLFRVFTKGTGPARGAAPNAGWLKDCFELDRKGFMLTGLAVGSKQVGGDVGSAS